jgi:iron uptake system component EfeO
MSLRDRRLPGPVRVLLPAVVPAAALLLVLTACGSKEQSGGSGVAASIPVRSTDDACDVGTTELTAGTHSFAVTNDGSAVTEFYIYGDGEKIVAEVENVAPGLSRELLAKLPAGTYEAVCKPGMVGDGIRQKLTVTGTSAGPAQDASLAQAGADYQAYVRGETAAFLQQTTAFVAAVKAGDIAGAKALYPTTRIHWERIEPVAESFGDLDPLIDGREGDQEAGQDFTGFHRIEQALWQTGDVSDMGPYADRLLADVQQIVTRADEVTLEPLQLANGAKALLDEIATGKITGEEERYSHTDLWDFAGNLEGSKTAIGTLRPFLQKSDPDLLAEIDDRFAATEGALDAHRAGDGWTLYDQLDQAALHTLSDRITALTESVSKVAAVVAGR